MTRILLHWLMLSMDHNQIKKNGFYIDIGSSNHTYLLEHKCHWTGVFIDANPCVVQNAIKDRPNSKCLTSLIWSHHTYLDFETEANNPLSGRVSNIPDNPDLQGIVNKKLIEAKTIDQACIDENIILPNIVDYIILDCNGSEIYILNYLLNQKKFYISNISIKYSSHNYLQKLLEKIKIHDKININKIDNEYIDISHTKTINKAVWVSDRGFFSILDKQLWYGYMDNKNIENLRLLESNQHCKILSNGIDTYKICNNELYQIISDNCHKITDGKWVLS
jgi:hypothetical protein